MKRSFLPFLTIFLFIGQDLIAQPASSQNNKELNALFDAYYEEGLMLAPLTATQVGDNRYNDLLPAEFTYSYLAKLTNYATRFSQALQKFKRIDLSENDRLSYDIFKWQLEQYTEGLKQVD